MIEHDPPAFGEHFADVYDEIYQWYRPTESQLATIRSHVPAGGRLLEIGAGTGRIAVPLAERGVEVIALDASPSMLKVLEEKAAGLPITTLCADAADFTLDEPVSAVLAVFNMVTLVGDERHQLNFLRACRKALRTGGALIIETIVPHEAALPGTSGIKVRSMSNTQVILEVGTHVAAAQRCDFQYVVLRHGEPVRLMPHRMRYLWPAQLDALAADAGLRLVSRCADWRGGEFEESASASHVSIFTPMDEA
ncbi:class I SAM-dependent methyltransferase [Actinoplanes subtropicus]|uniref:class I SAM-dependent methyltransferase n=1 Tax=Actinoplanes subtropicus TaxID=543632 RepID=UPI0004C2C8BD|nr:class I SAM-dependent methyltransferase [Actinoplanes subtropicus]